MTVISPGEILDSTNSKLDLFTQLDDALVDVFSVEWNVWDLVVPATPVQIEPVAGRNTLTLTAPPGGHRLSLGHYFAPWTVPGGIGTNNHEIRWYFKLTASSPEVTSEEEFSVLNVSGHPDLDSQSVLSFRERFPQFASLSSTLIQLALDEAARSVDSACVGPVYNEAHAYLTAHILEMTVGTTSKKVASVSAGQASIAYFGAHFGMKSASSLMSTPYGQMYLDIIRAFCGTMRVLC